MYPALDIKRGGSVTPTETYVSWKDNHRIEDAKLICKYHLRNDPEFISFEKTKLFGNKLFHDFKQPEPNVGIYVFDFGYMKADWQHFLEGKYSKFSVEHKKKIKTYTGFNSSDMPYVESFLEPTKYFRIYSEMMDVKETLLRSVGELCSAPNLEKETLEIPINNLHISQIIT